MRATRSPESLTGVPGVPCGEGRVLALSSFCVCMTSGMRWDRGQESRGLTSSSAASHAIGTFSLVLRMWRLRSWKPTLVVLAGNSASKTEFSPAPPHPAPTLWLCLRMAPTSHSDDNNDQLFFLIPGFWG